MHIGANRGMGCPCPVYSDGTFKFIPIKENFPSPQSWTYEKLQLQDVVPNDWKFAHNDPEFETFTWGDYINKRTYPTRQLTSGDYVFFIATLQRAWSQSKPNWVDPEWGYSIVSYFALESPVPIARDLVYPLPKQIIERFPNNAHILRDYEKLKEHYGKNINDKPFCIFKGNDESQLLKFAVPISSKNAPNELAEATIQNLNSAAPRWWANAILNQEDVVKVLAEIRKVGN